MSEAKQLIKERGLIKAKLTRFKTYLDTVSNVDQITQLKVRLAKLETYWLEYDQIQLKIELQDDSEDQFKDRENFETEFFSLTSAAQDLINSYSIQAHNEISTTKHHSVPVKLPDIKLPTFSGNYDEWMSFHDTFVSLIHSREVSEIHKFHYLRCSLKGEAAEILSSLEGSVENYDVAWKLLKARYGNKRFLINKHISALFNLSRNDREHALSLRNLLDSALKHIRALSGLGQPIQHWDTLLIHLITTKLDSITLREWETSLEMDQLPILSDLETFLQHKCQVMESIETSRSYKSHANSQFSHKAQSPKLNSFKKNNTLFTNCHVSTKTCSLCNQPQHPIYFCKTFKMLSIPDRELEVKKRGLCFNCLNSQHKTVTCQSGSCKHCGKKHNSLLHYIKPNSNVTQNKVSVNGSMTPELNLSNADNSAVAEVVTATSHNSCQGISSSPVLLSTAIVSVLDYRGTSHLCRVLLDSGSESNFMTEGFVKKLGLHSMNFSVEVNGIGSAKTKTSKIVQCVLKSRFNSFSASIDCVVLPLIIKDLPTAFIDRSHIKVPSNLQLADPYFNQPNAIDLLIGAELFFDLLLDGRFKMQNSSPTLQNTVLGWIISGKIMQQITSSHITTCNVSTLHDINKILHRFWEIEDCDSERQFTGHDKRCEELFIKTITRNEHGRYCVTIPLKGDVCELGDSRESTLKRFLSMERRLSTKPEMRLQYIQFMKEYEELGHMKEITPSEAAMSKAYYIPHHAVIKEDSTTTKLRVVFDASSKTSSGLSLNDISMSGPTVQSDLVNIIIRFRTHPFVITGDIEKMYRQVNVNPAQQNLQLILWREQPKDPIKTFKLQTITYGTASAPYLATRTLKQLALDEGSTFPTASKVLMEDFYVDDVMTGASTIEDTKKLLHNLSELLHRGGFHLRKWTSNQPSILSDIPLKDKSSDCFEINPDATIKTLGLIWNPSQDILQFSIDEETETDNITKRTILSAIGKIFDPLGIIGPVILTAKLIMQQLWTYPLGWDDKVPEEVLRKWTQFQGELHLLSKIRVPRAIVPKGARISRIEIHGFADASEAAYGACIYLKCVDHDNNISVHLITSKSRVAPLKRISLPRLELCAALLLSELSKITIKALCLHINSVSYYTDSTVTLAWIQAPSSHWTTFVANRVSKIQTNTEGSTWKHVKSEDNPADHLSRGLLPSKILDAALYWTGPTFLHESVVIQDQPIRLPILDQMPERRYSVLSSVAIKEHFINFSNFSTFIRIQRVMSYCLRFIHNSQLCNSRFSGPLSVSELQLAESTLIKIVQRESFSTEFHALKLGNPLSKTSKLISLTPFLDQNDVIRVGGRLQNSTLTPDQIHPIVLPKNHIVTELIARHCHIRSLHAGPQLLLNIIRQKYWPINGRNLVRKIYHECNTCFKANPRGITQIMGNLPRARVIPSLRPFVCTGIDYCGPFWVKASRKRGIIPQKCYVSLFVCFSTKAIHLELAEDLSSDSFISALKRFIARRGKPSDIYSDNGTNFVGAQRELIQLAELFRTEHFQSNVTEFSSIEGIKWHFQPPNAPHFGGLWESSVKLVKSHMRRVIGTNSLTIIEFTTLLAQIEACVNSRPLTPMSDEPSDLRPLTPAHFLIGDTFSSLPEPNLQSFPVNKLDYWQQIQQQTQHFWSRWSREYLNNLQQRSKWRNSITDLRENDLVIVKEDNLPPLQWKMARVINIHPGKDERVRVVTLKTSHGTLKRPISKLCLLPKQ